MGFAQQGIVETLFWILGGVCGNQKRLGDTLLGSGFCTKMFIGMGHLLSVSLGRGEKGKHVICHRHCYRHGLLSAMSTSRI